jgi:uncharacterized membrane protein YgcG
MNYCLKGPDDQVVGFRLGTDDLGHEIYDILDWADEHFSSYFVEQTDECVYVCSEGAREAIAADRVEAEPLSIESGDQDNGSSRGGSLGGGGSAGGGPSGGGGSSGDGSDGNVPVGGDGGSEIELASR